MVVTYLVDKTLKITSVPTYVINLCQYHFDRDVCNIIYEYTSMVERSIHIGDSGTKKLFLCRLSFRKERLHDFNKLCLGK